MTALTNIYTKTEADNKFQPKGSYLTAITKAQVEAVLTGNITSHTHAQYAPILLLANYVERVKLDNNTDIAALTGSHLYYSDTDGNTATMKNSPFAQSFMMLTHTCYNNGDDIRRARLAVDAFGGIKVFDDRSTAGTGGTWHTVLTDKNTKITNGTITINGTSITPLISHQSLANYVTLNTAQNITGVKTFINGLMPLSKGLPWGAYQDGLYGTRIYQDGIAIRPSASGSDGGWLRMIETTANSGQLELAIGDDGNEPIYVRGYNTSGSVTRAIILLDASGNQDFNTVSALALKKKGGTSSQFLMADGSVATKHTLSSVTNLGWGGTSGQVVTINTLAYWNGQYAAGGSNLMYCDRGRFGTMATMDAADYPTIERFNSGISFTAGKFPDQGMLFNVMHDEGAIGMGITVNIPTKTSHLTNDSGFLTGSGADAKYVTALRVTGDALTWVKNGLGNNITLPYAAESRVLRSYGRITAVTDNTAHGVGVRLFEAYNNGYPTTYGNVLAVQGSTAIGGGELLMGWSGTNEGHASLYYRNRRDTASANWSPWATILDSVNYSTTLDSRYLKKAGDMMTGELIIKTSAFGGQLNIFRNDTGGNSVIKYTNAEKLLGYIGIGGSGGVFQYEPMFSGENGTWYKILHSGNYGSVLGNVYAATSRVGALESTVSGHTSQINGLTGSVGAKVSKAGDTMTGALNAPNVVAKTAFTTSAGKVSGLAAGTAALYANGLAISNPATANDVGWIRVTGTGETDTVLEIATGDDGGAGEQIVVRQYNTSNAIAREAKLFDTAGNTSFPGRVNASYFTANATTLCTNLNADLLDGRQGYDYTWRNHLGYQTDSKAAYVLLSLAYNGTRLAGSYFYGTVYITRGGSGAFNAKTTVMVQCGGQYENNMAQYQVLSASVGIAGLYKVIYNGVAYIALKMNAASQMSFEVTGWWSGFNPALVSQGDSKLTSETALTTTPYIASCATSATKLQTARTLWGRSFDGTGNVDGAMTVNYSGVIPGISLYRKEAGSGAFISFYGANQTTNYFRIGMAGDGHFSMCYNGGADGLSISAGGNVRVGYTNDSYKLAAASFICNSWIRTVGSAGWYSETYGGGWCMTDGTWIRIHGGKSLYAASGIIRTDGELQVGGGGDKFRVTAAGAVTATSFTKRGGTASQILAANGTVRNVLVYDDLSDNAIDIRDIVIGEADPVITREALSGWDGSSKTRTLVNGTATDVRESYLAYCNKGAFGTMATKNADDYVTRTTAQTISGAKIFDNEVTAISKWVIAKIITGETNASNNTAQKKKSHSIELGYPNHDYMNFNEYGGVFNFYKTNTAYTAASGDGTLVAKITQTGITAASFVKSGGTASQVLMADGSVRGVLTSSVGAESGFAIPASSPQNSLVEQWWLMLWDGRYMLYGDDTPHCTLQYCKHGKFGDIVTHNASEFLTSHQSLANYVTTNTAQTISGKKTFTGGMVGSNFGCRGNIYLYSSAYNSQYRTVMMAVSSDNASDTTYGHFSMWTLQRTGNTLDGTAVSGSAAALMGFDKSNNMLVGAYGGSTTAQAKLHVVGGIYASGNISGATLTNRSDARLKDIVGDVRLTCRDIAAAPTVYFRWKDDPSRIHVGTIAQNIEKLLPEAVYEGGDGRLSVAYGNLAHVEAAIACRGVVKLEDDMEALRSRVDSLEAENRALKQEIERIKAA